MLSMTQAGNYTALISILVAILAHYGVKVEESELTTIITNIITVVGVLVSIYGRYRHGDVTLLGIKKEEELG